MILEVVAIVILILIIIVSLVLLIPFRVIANGSANLSTSKFDVRLSWLGITFWKIQPAPSAEAKKEGPEKKSTRPSAGKLRHIASLFLKCLPEFEILFRSLKRAIRIRKLGADLAFGTGDPADTALIAGYLWSLAWAVFGAFPAINFSIRPDLENVSFDGSLNTDTSVRLLFIATGFVKAYSKKPFREFIKEVRTMR